MALTGFTITAIIETKPDTGRSFGTKNDWQIPKHLIIIYLFIIFYGNWKN